MIRTLKMKREHAHILQYIVIYTPKFKCLDS